MQQLLLGVEDRLNVRVRVVGVRLRFIWCYWPSMCTEHSAVDSFCLYALCTVNNISNGIIYRARAVHGV